MITSQCLYWLEFTIGILYIVCYILILYIKCKHLYASRAPLVIQKLAFLVVEGYVYGRLSEVE